MNESEYAGPSVTGQPSGQPNVLAVSGEFDPNQPSTEIWLADGRVARLLTSVLVQSSDVWRTPTAPLPTSPIDDAALLVIPLVEEKLEIGKRTITTGTIRLTKTVQEYTESLDEVLAVRTFDVERRVLNQPVDAPPPIRQEGNVTIYSLVEEQMVLTKQLVLKEEVRIVQHDTERHDTQAITLHKEHLTVERSDLN